MTACKCVRSTQEEAGDLPAVLWTHEEVAKLLRITPDRLYRLVSAGEGPPSFKLGKLRLYDPAELAKWLRQRRGDSEGRTR